MLIFENKTDIKPLAVLCLECFFILFCLLLSIFDFYLINYRLRAHNNKKNIQKKELTEKTVENFALNGNAHATVHAIDKQLKFWRASRAAVRPGDVLQKNTTLNLTHNWAHRTAVARC